LKLLYTIPLLSSKNKEESGKKASGEGEKNGVRFFVSRLRFRVNLRRGGKKEKGGKARSINFNLHIARKGRREEDEVGPVEKEKKEEKREEIDCVEDLILLSSGQGRGGRKRKGETLWFLMLRLDRGGGKKREGGEGGGDMA